MHRDVGAFARIARGRLNVTAKPDAAQALALARRFLKPFQSPSSIARSITAR